MKETTQSENIAVKKSKLDSESDKPKPKDSSVAKEIKHSEVAKVATHSDVAKKAPNSENGSADIATNSNSQVCSL